MLDHAAGCRAHNTGCDGDCDCRSFAELDAALNDQNSRTSREARLPCRAVKRFVVRCLSALSALTARPRSR